MASENEGRERGPVRFPPPLIYVGGLALGWVLEFVKDTPNLPLGAALGIGGLLAAAGLAVDISATQRFMKAKTGIPPWTPATTIVSAGPYRFSRNPMYVGMALLYLGITIAAGIWWALAFGPVVLIAIDRLVIQREEAYLTAKFGDGYTSYKATVRRWL